MWNDECALALNLINNWNFFSPLEYSQAAPQLFMYLSKILYTILPYKTIALRIIPLISSIISIFIFYKLTVKLFLKRISVYIATILFSICYPLCYYAQEFKQYSSDVFCFLLILLSYFYIDKLDNNNYKKIIYGITCSILMWISFSSIFAILSILAALIIYNRKKIKDLALCYIPIIINFVIFAICNMHLNNNEFLHTYWDNAFINKGFIKFVELFISNIQYIFNTGLPFFYIIIAIVIMIIKSKREISNSLIILPLCFTLILSYVKIYPFSTRVVLFLIPVLIILAAKILDYINTKYKIINIILYSIIIITLLIPTGLQTLSKIGFKNYESEDIITPLTIAIKNAHQDDIIYIAEGNAILFNYYSRYINTKGHNIIIEEDYYTDNDEYANHLNRLPKGKRYFWIYAHHNHKFERLKSVYIWAKKQKDFQIYTDNKGNAVISFVL